jgi:hypothetical protein
MSRKGVCRHRSYAFVITAHRLGLPARFVHNEAHAWVEVFDGALWHRIDLGGAAGRMEYERPPEVPLHRPPKDELPWPSHAAPASAAPGIPGSGSSSGARADGSDREEARGADLPGRSSLSLEEARGFPTSPEGPDPRASVEGRALRAAESEVSLDLGHQAIRRGHPLRVLGHLKGPGSQCGFGRVDFALRTTEGRIIPLGSLPTDAQGAYAGEVVIPLEVPVGEHHIQVTSPGAPGCGPSR